MLIFSRILELYFFSEIKIYIIHDMIHLSLHCFIMQKTEKKKNLTVNSLLRNAFSSGIFSIFPGPTFLLIHCKEINSNTCTVRFVGRKKKATEFLEVEMYPFYFMLHYT